TPARLTASFSTSASRSTGWTSLRLPFRFPIGLRTAPTMTASRISGIEGSFLATLAAGLIPTTYRRVTNAHHAHIPRARVEGGMRVCLHATVVAGIDHDRAHARRCVRKTDPAGPEEEVADGALPVPGGVHARGVGVDEPEPAG